MAATFLETLRKFQLESYYVQLISSGVHSLDILSAMPLNTITPLLNCGPEDTERLSQLLMSIKIPAQQSTQLQQRPSSGGRRLSISSSRRSSLSNSQLDAYGVPLKDSNKQLSKSQPLNSSLTQYDRIRVCVRKRPLSGKEIAKQEKDIAEIVSRNCVLVHEPKTKVDLTKYIEKHQFVFDEVFDCDASNEIIYTRTAQPLVESIFYGGKSTCFAYGQTGSGKTFTMLDPYRGLYMLACKDIFRILGRSEYTDLHAAVSFFEIYQGQLYDLLNSRQKVFAREDGNSNVIIQGIQEVTVGSPQDLMQIFERGSEERSVGKTGANSDSSRSHAILQISIKTNDKRNKTVGKFSFIDLAGSERGADRGETDNKTRMEGSEINKSLLALKECIRALDQDSKHTPFRQSKLTQVLKDSFIGNSRTCMIATISPNSGNSEHTLNTLRYADRVKELKNEQNGQDSTTQEQQLQKPQDRKSIPPIQKSNSSKDVPDLQNQIFQDPNNSLLIHDEQLPDVSLDYGSQSPSEQNVKKVKKELLTDLNKDKRRSNIGPNISKSYGNSLKDGLSNGNPISQSNKDKRLSMNNSASRIARPSAKTSKVESNEQFRENIQKNKKQDSNSPKSQKLSVDFMSLDKINEFIRAHRRQIRETVDTSKSETLLLSQLANFGFQTINSNAGSQTDLAQNENQQVSSASVITPEMKTAFLDYAFSLDRLLEKKVKSINSLRSQVRDLILEANNKGK